MGEFIEIKVNVDLQTKKSLNNIVHEKYNNKHEDFYRDLIEKYLQSQIPYTELNFAMGISYLTKRKLENLVRNNKKVNVILIGTMVFSREISFELAKKTLNSLKVYGILICNSKMKKELISKHILI
ncbi:hypothetical protein [Rossellomorea sp. LjRoot5]|uniref:hypothetical protein n=1 Tax=Rossellomorea sp. LjRoot5 TaxID=3342331 RepID=UPI003ECE7107